MTRLSSGATVFMKWAMPVAWLGIVGGVGALMWRDPHVEPLALAMVCLMPVFFGAIYRFQIWPLADDVEDVGDALRVRRRGVELRVPLRDIVNVSVPNAPRSRRITLRLRRPGDLGDEITFLPRARMTWNLFARDPMAEDLIRRVDAAREESMR